MCIVSNRIWVTSHDNICLSLSRWSGGQRSGGSLCEFLGGWLPDYERWGILAHNDLGAECAQVSHLSDQWVHRLRKHRSDESQHRTLCPLFFFAQVNAVCTPSLLTPLHKAALHGHDQILTLLLHHSANFKARGCIAEVLPVQMTPILAYFISVICHMSSLTYDIFCHLCHMSAMTYDIWH